VSEKDLAGGGGGGGVKVVDLFVQLGLASSKKEARRLIQGGGAKVNEENAETKSERVAKIHQVSLHLQSSCGSTFQNLRRKLDARNFYYLKLSHFVFEVKLLFVATRKCFFLMKKKKRLDFVSLLRF
jgi:ribosomal protein S4